MDVSTGGAAPAAAAPVNTGNSGTNAPAKGAPSPGGVEPGPKSPPQAGLPSKEPAKPSPSPDVREYKVNGKIVKMTQKEADDYVSMSYAANEKFNEAKKLRTDVDKIIANAKTNPIEALMDPSLGLTKDQIRDAFEKWYHKEYIEPESLTEDQRKLKDYESKLKKYEEEETLKKKQAEDDENLRLTNQQRDYLQNQIVEAMEASGLPKTKFFASRMAFYMRQNLANGWDAPIDMIVKQVKTERQAMMADLAQDASAEQLISMFGNDVINKIRQHDLKQLREKRQLPPASGSQNRAGTGVTGEKIYSSDVQKRLREIRAGK